MRHRHNSQSLHQGRSEKLRNECPEKSMVAPNNGAISYEGDLRLIIEGMLRQVARALPECKMKIWRSRLDSVNTVSCCFLTTVITETINLDDLEQAMREHIRNRPGLPQDTHWKLENRVVKRSHQTVNQNQEWQPKEQKEVSVEAVHVISTAEDEEHITNMMSGTLICP
jgi:hypothetical protein